MRGIKSKTKSLQLTVGGRSVEKCLPTQLRIEKIIFALSDNELMDNQELCRAIGFKKIQANCAAQYSRNVKGKIWWGNRRAIASLDKLLRQGRR